ncbi:unnamed protein product [Somion occarium]|uniref:Arrestin-like N-terminal domain-containing protein n=1 Tax=Somion occarium TaxID=3059160 RepID=A0ABP1DYM8_9APHY
MRHPFASVQYFRSSLSSESLESSQEQRVPSRRGENRRVITPAPRLQHPFSAAPNSEPVRRARSASLTRATPRIPFSLPRRKPSAISIDTQPSGKVGSEAIAPPSSGKASPGHFVKHSSKITVLLSGQKENASEPVYSNGATIIGILAIPKPSGLLTLEVKVEGHIKLKEVAGGGAFDGEIINETLFIWDSEHDATFPSKVNFRYTLPTHYTNGLTGEKSRLPPSFEAYLPGIPGFDVNISYGIYVYLTRTRDRSDWWRKGKRLRIPFRYKELTRPVRAGPFPLSMTKTPSIPKTVFAFSLRTRRRNYNDVEVHLFLPCSRVCTLKEPIPFSVTLFGDEDSLAPFSTYQPSPSSFHPLSHNHSITSSIQTRFNARIQPNLLPPPIRVQLSRRTAVDALAAGMMIAEEKGHMAFTRPLGQGVIHKSSRGPNSMTWSGSFAIPPSITTGGFTTSGVKVTHGLPIDSNRTPSCSPSCHLIVHVRDLCRSAKVYPYGSLPSRMIVLLPQSVCPTGSKRPVSSGLNTYRASALTEDV